MKMILFILSVSIFVSFPFIYLFSIFNSRRISRFFATKDRFSLFCPSLSLSLFPLIISSLSLSLVEFPGSLRRKIDSLYFVRLYLCLFSHYLPLLYLCLFQNFPVHCDARSVVTLPKDPRLAAFRNSAFEQSKQILKKKIDLEILFSHS